MRILLVNDLDPAAGWGAELYLSRLIDGLTAAGDEVEVFAGVVAHSGASRLLDVWDPSSRRKLARAAALFRPNVVHHHNVIRELSVSVLGVPRDVATVLTVHDLRLFGVPDGAASRPLRAAIALKGRFDVAVARKRAHVAVAVSQEIERRLRRAGFPSVEYVPVFAPEPPDPVLSVASSTDVVYAGRLTRDKGAHVLLEAFSRVAAGHPAARLVIAGDGPDRSMLEAAGAALGDRVRFLGRVSAEQVREAMGRARVIVAPVIPSLRPEGAGLTVIEAALLGRPSIVSDDPALREFVDTARAGIVVQPASASDLAEALDLILDDPDLATQFGEAGRRLALERHTTTAIVPKMRAIYRRAVEGGAAARA